MIISLVSYFCLTLALLFALAMMILRIGREIADCETAPAGMSAAAATVTTAFIAIGLGGVVLAASLIVLSEGISPIGLISALGLAALCLGLGFTQSMASLRALAAPSLDPRKVK